MIYLLNVSRLFRAYVVLIPATLAGFVISNLDELRTGTTRSETVGLIALGTLICIAMPFVLSAFLSLPLTVSRLDRQSLQRLGQAARNNWLLQVPVSDQLPVTVTMADQDSTAIMARLRFAAAVVIGPISIALTGVAMIAALIAIPLDGSDASVCYWLGIALMAMGTFLLIPLKLNTAALPGWVALRCVFSSQYFESLCFRNRLIRFEFLHSMRPSDLPTSELGRKIRGIAFPPSRALALTLDRMNYLTALDTQNWSATEVYARRLEGVLETNGCNVLDRMAITLLLAFHNAYIRQNPIEARALLSEHKGRMAIKTTPIGFLTEGLIANLTGQTETSGKQIALAAAKWKIVAHPSGTSTMWLSICDRFLSPKLSTTS